MSWVKKGVFWFYDDDTTQGILIPVDDIGWEARAKTAAARMQPARFFTSASARESVEVWAAQRRDRDPSVDRHRGGLGSS